MRERPLAERTVQALRNSARAAEAARATESAGKGGPATGPLGCTAAAAAARQKTAQGRAVRYPYRPHAESPSRCYNAAVRTGTN